MTDDNCSDCGLAHQLHIREDGIYECPGDTSASDAPCGLCREPMSSHTTTMACPGRHVSALHDTSSEYADSYMRSDSPDPLLLAPDKQLPQQHYAAFRRSAQPEGAVVPLRRSSRVENRRRTREDAGPYPQAQIRRSSIRMSEDPVRSSRSRRVSLQDNRGRSYENEALLPTQNHAPRRKSLRPQVLDYILVPGPNHSTRRRSLQPHVLDRMLPVEDMEPIEGFRPFTELDPGQLPDPVTVREPIRDIARPPFVFVRNPSVVIPAVGGMRVRVGQFERRGNPAQFAGRSAAYEGETCAQSSGSEGYFTAQDWSSSSSTPEHHASDHEGPSVDTSQYTASPPLTFPSPGPPQPEFIQGSSKSVLPSQQQGLPDDARDTNPSSWENEFPQFHALARHYAAVQNQKKDVALPQLTPSPRRTMEPMPSAATFTPFQHPGSSGAPCPSLQVPSTPTPAAPQPPPVEQPHARAKHPPCRSSMPGTLPGAGYCPSEWTASTPERIETELAVDDVEDWATREPWEYIHRVLTTSTCPLVLFLKTPTTDIPAAAQGALGADLHLQKMLIDNEHWLLIGPRDINLYEYGVRFQMRAATQDKFVFRFGNLNWGANVNQIEDEVCKAVMESSRRAGGIPTALPAQFMAGAMGGLVVWYALSLM